MAEDKDFWESDQEDFWKKPVIDKDWLKDTSQSDKKPEVQTQSEFQNNPYKQNAETDIQKESEPAEETVPIEKKIPIHTIICLSFMVLAVVATAASFLYANLRLRKAKSIAENVSFKETEVLERFSFNENNTIYLEDQAYTIIDADTVYGLPRGEKLIAVFVEAMSEEYKKDSYAIDEFYIGYENHGRWEYKNNITKETVFPYVTASGFNRNSLLENYGIGNGDNFSGYYFFMVPAHIEEITFNLEKREIKNGISVLTELFYRHQTILRENAEVTTQLVNREVFS